MLTFNPSSLRTSPVDAATKPSSGGGGAPNGSADPAGFASLLRQTQAAPRPAPPMPERAPATAPAPVPAPAPSPQPASAAPAPKPAAGNGATTEPVITKESPDDATTPQRADATSRARAQQKGKGRPADGAAPGREGKPTLDTGTTRDPLEIKTETHPGGDCLAPETRLTAADAPIDPSVMQWLADLQRAAGQVDAPDGKGAPDTAANAGIADAALNEATGGTQNRRAAELKADADLKDQATRGQAQLPEAAGSLLFAAALNEQGPAEKPIIKAIDAPKDVGGIGPSALSPPPTHTEGITPAAVPIGTPVTAPDFAQELGLRLSVLAKDGVQTAELHLNPADMGPVSVQIVMDGTQARVDFGADMAATRQAIEAGLPELASALREAGFTLAGGGVSQHAGGRGGGGGSESSGGENTRRIVVEDQVKRAATAARRIVTQGGVDLFA